MKPRANQTTGLTNVFSPFLALFRHQLEPNSVSSSSYDTTLRLFGLDGYVQLIWGGDHFTL